MALNLALCLCVYLLFTKGAEGSIDVRVQIIFLCSVLNSIFF